MKKQDADIFFGKLSRKIDIPIYVTILGGAVASLLGSTRTTYDIDFQVKLARRTSSREGQWALLEQAINQVVEETGIQAQYSEDVDRWGSIVLIKKPEKLYKRFGSIQVALMHPLTWAIGKLSRLHSTDINDLIYVFKSQETDAKEAARLWGKALGESPQSNAQPLFKRNVIHFFQTYGRTIWGRSVNSSQLTELFLKAARSAAKPK